MPPPEEALSSEIVSFSAVSVPRRTWMPPPGPDELLSTTVLLVIVSAPPYTEMPPPPWEPAELSLKVQPEIEPDPVLESRPPVVLA